MSRGRSSLLERTIWAPDQLEADLARSKEIFRHERLEEPLEAYLEAFEEVQDAIENLLEETVDLDLVVGLWDTRIMPIECKVSNSSTNSVKRLNNDAAVKAEIWTKDFGGLTIIPAAVLSGVYKRHNLENAQRRGLTIYWAHRLEDMTLWMDKVRSSLRFPR